MSSSSEVVIRARNLSKAYFLYPNRRDWLKQMLFGSLRTYYRKFWALRDVNLEIRRGESVGILGRNGSGKSTLLSLICGMTRPTTGELWVKGRVAPILALGATFDQEATGRQNVLIAAGVLGLPREAVVQKFSAIEEFAGIGEFMEQPLRLYSSGMRTRLAFAICAQVSADILIIDEALSVGDAAFQRKCTDWIDRFKKSGTLLFVSHSPSEVERLCQQAIWVDNGRIRLAGTPREIIPRYLAALADEADDTRRFSAEQA